MSSGNEREDLFLSDESAAKLLDRVKGSVNGSNNAQSAAIAAPEALTPRVRAEQIVAEQLETVSGAISRILGPVSEDTTMAQALVVKAQVQLALALIDAARDIQTERGGKADGKLKSALNQVHAYAVTQAMQRRLGAKQSERRRIVEAVPAQVETRDAQPAVYKDSELRIDVETGRAMREHDTARPHVHSEHTAVSDTHSDATTHAVDAPSIDGDAVSYEGSERLTRDDRRDATD